MNQRARVIVALAAAAILLITTVTSLALLVNNDDDTSSSDSGTSEGAPAGEPITSDDMGDIDVSGKFGEKPTVTLPGGDAPTNLQELVLSEGDGAEVQSGDVLVADYLGVAWTDEAGAVSGDDVFDNSFDRGEPLVIPIGVGGVISGWDRVLVGKKIGSRVLLSAPPSEAYGEATADSQEANPLGGQTLVFVVDIVESVSKDAFADGEVVTDLPDGLPEIDSEPGKAPTLVDATTAAPVTENLVAQLITGNGATIDDDQTVVVQILQADASGQMVQTTWETNGPATYVLGNLLGDFPQMSGTTVGSRFAAVLPNEEDSNNPGILIIDVVGAF